MASSSSEKALPRPLRVFGIPLAGIFFVSLFVYLGFPFDKLGNRIATEIQRTSGVRVEFRKLSPRLRFAGPGIEASAVRATFPGGDAFAFERVQLRPAWSLSWLRGDPAVYAEVTSAFGNAEGMLVLGGSTGWYGDLESVAVGRLPLAKLITLATLDGLVDARIDVRMGEEGPEGEASFVAKNGSLGISRFPVEIPFETLTAELRFGDDAFVAIQRFDLEGPMVSGAITGSVLRAARFEQAPLRLEANLETKANVRSAMKGAGIRLDRNGTAKVRITGTVSQPNVR